MSRSDMTQSTRLTARLPSSRHLGRRALLIGAMTAVLALSGLAIAQQRKPALAAVPVEELMKPGELPDVIVGKVDAPVTVVEYASLTCGACGAFHQKVFPELKKKYVDTGKVRFIIREFPLDNLAAAAAMLARCLPAEKSHDFVTVLFEQQEKWAFVRTNPVPALFEIAKQAGFTQEAFDKCLTDQSLLDKITAARARASEKFQINATPTFFINGKRLEGAGTLENFDKALAPLLKG